MAMLLQQGAVMSTDFPPFEVIVAIFYPFSQFCEVQISLLSLQKQPNTAPNLFQRRVEYGKYGGARKISNKTTMTQ